MLRNLHGGTTSVTAASAGAGGSAKRIGSSKPKSAARHKDSKSPGHKTGKVGRDHSGEAVVGLTKAALTHHLRGTVADQSHSPDSDAGSIDLEAVRARDFMQRKENSLLQNRKLKMFYERHREESEVSVFTMAENALIIRDNDLSEGSPSKSQ